MKHSAPKLPVADAGAFDRLVLTGFMGSGKTTVGRMLADHLGWTFVDLDAVIELATGRSVPAIFAESGEVEFRRIESAALTSALRSSPLVLALGGGAPETPGNRELLAIAPRTAVVYLAAPFATLLDRCQRQAGEAGSTARPVLADAALAEARFLGREAHYKTLATHTIATESRSPAEILQAVLSALRMIQRSPTS